MTNLSQNRRERILSFLQELKEKHSEDDKYIIAIGEIENELNSKKYGLVWEQHEEAVNATMCNNFPVFTEVKEKEIIATDKNEYNFLLEGDNLHSLKLLEKTHPGKIDLIYIDPPYNMGAKDFKYNDNFVNQDDAYSHSKWLSFMKERLSVARKLLAEDGIIAISIDYHEGYQLKLLLDEIFGEENFSSDLHIETSAIAGPRRFAAMNGSVVKTTEFIFIYTKNPKTKIVKNPMYDFIVGFDMHYNKFVNKDTGLLENFSTTLNNTSKVVEIFKKYNLKINLKNLGKLVQLDEELKNWLYSEEIATNLFRLDSKIDIDHSELTKGINIINNKYVVLNENHTPYTAFRYSDRIGPTDGFAEEFGERTVRGNLWKGFSSDGGNLNKEGGVDFKNGKKPLRLIKQIIKTLTEPDKDITILDFFAGSGTTGHAVIQLNKEDGGNRRFILCTNNENKICEEITYERLKKVIYGYGDSLGTPTNLKYYRTDFVPKDTPYLSDALVTHIEEMVQLEHGIRIDDKEYILILTDDDADELESNWSKENQLKALYVSRDVLFTARQNQLFSKVEIHVIPDYYFGLELKEVGESW